MGYSTALSRDVFQPFIKYLGIYLGPGAHKHMWNDVMTSFRETVAFLRTTVPGLVPTIALYNILAHSKFSHILAFYPPSVEVLRLERKSHQLLTRGPWNAFPPKLLFNLKAIGIRLQFQSLELTSMASRVRNGLITIPDFCAILSEARAFFFLS